MRADIQTHVVFAGRTSECPRCMDAGRHIGGIWHTDTPPSVHASEHCGWYYQHGESNIGPDSDWSGPWFSEADAINAAKLDLWEDGQ